MRTKLTLRFLTLPFVAACALSLPIGSEADTLPRVKASAGDYEATPKKLSTTQYQYGKFSVVNEGGKRRIVATENLSVISYPYVAKCEGALGVPLATESIPISRKGRFSVRDVSKSNGRTVTVVWKGAWYKPNRVEGTLKLTYGDCSSKIDWVGKRTASPTG